MMANCSILTSQIVKVREYNIYTSNEKNMNRKTHWTTNLPYTAKVTEGTPGQCIKSWVLVIAALPLRCHFEFV